MGNEFISWKGREVGGGGRGVKTSLLAGRPNKGGGGRPAYTKQSDNLFDCWDPAKPVHSEATARQNASTVGRYAGADSMQFTLFH